MHRIGQLCEEIVEHFVGKKIAHHQVYIQIIYTNSSHQILNYTYRTIPLNKINIK